MARPGLAGFTLFLICAHLLSGQGKSGPAVQGTGSAPSVELIVLGNVQDGGAPHMGCEKSCCAPLYEAPDPALMVVSLGLLDAGSAKAYLFEATPDMPEQMGLLRALAPFPAGPAPDGIFITHAHIGHYTGLMYLGRESLNAKGVPVYSLPRFAEFLSANGPWDQLQRLENISVQPLSEQVVIRLSPRLQVKAFRVPHRDEYSETAGFQITGPEKSALFIPDIDKWERWEVSLIECVRENDFVFIDASFYDSSEIGYRDIAEIPHPFVVETLALLEPLPAALKSRVHFIHMNHTNPLLNPESKASRAVTAAGFRIARTGDRFPL